MWPSFEISGQWCTWQQKPSQNAHGPHESPAYKYQDIETPDICRLKNLEILPGVEHFGSTYTHSPPRQGLSFIMTKFLLL